MPHTLFLRERDDQPEGFQFLKNTFIVKPFGLDLIAAETVYRLNIVRFGIFPFDSQDVFDSVGSFKAVGGNHGGPPFPAVMDVQQGSSSV